MPYRRELDGFRTPTFITVSGRIGPRSCHSLCARLGESGEVNCSRPSATSRPPRQKPPTLRRWRKQLSLRSQNQMASGVNGAVQMIRVEARRAEIAIADFAERPFLGELDPVQWRRRTTAKSCGLAF